MNPAAPERPGTLPFLSAKELGGIAIFWSIPLLPLLTFTVEWLVAWATLGHIPVPGVNDPKYISGFSSFLHSLTALSLLLVVPGGVIAALVYLLCWGSGFRKLSVAAIGAGMPFGVFAALDKFPYDAFGWWFD